jgi:hypothetical protein
MKRKCPLCRKPTLVLDMGGQSGKYQCTNCDYLGPISLEED